MSGHQQWTASDALMPFGKRPAQFSKLSYEALMRLAPFGPWRGKQFEIQLDVLELDRAGAAESKERFVAVGLHSPEGVSFFVGT